MGERPESSANASLCPFSEEDILGYVLDCHEGLGDSKIKDHLEHCPHCQNTFNKFQDVEKVVTEFSGGVKSNATDTDKAASKALQEMPVAIGGLRPSIPCAAMVVTGVQGSAKTSMCRLLIWVFTPLDTTQVKLLYKQEWMTRNCFRVKI
jgi:hypothetical protein